MAENDVVEGKLCCGSCDHVFDEGDAGPPVYECGSCSGPQVGEDEDARKCQQCHKFCAKVADRSCPECEAPDEEFKPATRGDLARVEREREEAEERKRNPPPPDSVLLRIQRERAEEKEADRRWWEEKGHAAFEGIGKSEEGGFGDLPARIEHFMINDGSDIIQLDKEELYELADRIRGEGK